MAEGSSKQRARERLKRRLASYGGAFTKKLKESLRRRKNISSGQLEKSIKTRTKWNYSEGRFRLTAEMLGYGKFLNKNNHPKSMPNIDAILDWIDTKGITPNGDGGVNTKKQLAYVIARSIQKKGFDTYNKHGVGWIDIIISEEIKRLRGKAKKDLRDAVKGMTIDALDFNKYK
tara:strand:- start:665 stop:1186 length:522 start_codon:yes stop_codon:yes gene_type:complete